MGVLKIGFVGDSDLFLRKYDEKIVEELGNKNVDAVIYLGGASRKVTEKVRGRKKSEMNQILDLMKQYNKVRVPVLWMAGREKFRPFKDAMEFDPSKNKNIFDATENMLFNLKNYNFILVSGGQNPLNGFQFNMKDENGKNEETGYYNSLDNSIRFNLNLCDLYEFPNIINFNNILVSSMPIYFKRGRKTVDMATTH